MTATAIESAPAQAPAAKLELFRVVLDWNPGNREEGDSCDVVWAVDERRAIAAMAYSMALERATGDASEDDIQDIAEKIENGAGPYAAERVSANIKRDLEQLISGPADEMTPEKRADLDALGSLLARYSIT